MHLYSKFLWDKAIKQVNTQKITYTTSKCHKNQHFQIEFEQKMGSFTYLMWGILKKN